MKVKKRWTASSLPALSPLQCVSVLWTVHNEVKGSILCHFLSPNGGIMTVSQNCCLHDVRSPFLVTPVRNLFDWTYNNFLVSC